MNIIYSFNKKKYEADCWINELSAASNTEITFIPFNHDPYLDPNLYLDAWQLDRLYQQKDSRLLSMYEDFTDIIRRHQADAIMVNNCPPYHPDFLKNLSIYKVLYSGDDPDSTYKRNIPYLHAYDHVFFADPVYSPDMDMQEKMRYCGMVNADWLPIGVFDFEHDVTKSETTILAQERDIDIIYIGNFFRQKLALIAKIKRTFGRRCRLHGFYRLKHNLYLNVIHGYVSWIRPVSFQDRIKLYQRAKIGFNLHWNDYGLGNQRLYHLPANGVMQICDCPSHLHRVFQTETEIVPYFNSDDLIYKLHYYLDHEDERQTIALKGYQRTMKDYRIKTIMTKAGQLIQEGMKKVNIRLLPSCIS